MKETRLLNSFPMFTVAPSWRGHCLPLLSGGSQRVDGAGVGLRSQPALSSPVKSQVSSVPHAAAALSSSGGSPGVGQHDIGMLK